MLFVGHRSRGRGIGQSELPLRVAVRPVQRIDVYALGHEHRSGVGAKADRWDVGQADACPPKGRPGLGIQSQHHRAAQQDQDLASVHAHGEDAVALAVHRQVGVPGHLQVEPVKVFLSRQRRPREHAMLSRQRRRRQQNSDNCYRKLFHESPPLILTKREKAIQTALVYHRLPRAVSKPGKKSSRGWFNSYPGGACP